MGVWDERSVLELEASTWIRVGSKSNWRKVEQVV